MAKCIICGGKVGLLSSRPICEDCTPLYDSIDTAKDLEELEKIKNRIKEINPEVITHPYINTPLSNRESFIINGPAKSIKERQEEYERRQEEYERRQVELIQAAKDVKVITTPGFEGYRIVDYKGFVFGESVVPNGLLGAFTSGTFFTIDALSEARMRAMNSLKFAAAKSSANAVIGMDIDITDLNNNGILVSANGTAVVIEKIEE